MAIRYARGPLVIMEARPASAFSRGDLVMFDSTSSLSAMNVLTPLAATKLAGVAMSASTASINGKVPYFIPQEDTVMWASLDSTSASRFTPTTSFDIVYANANGGHYVTDSANTPTAVIVQEPAETLPLRQSVLSEVLIKLSFNASSWAT
jgi:hypothetical protein